MEFEVAFVRESSNVEGRTLLLATPERLNLTNVSLKRLVLIAYGVQDYQLVGQPSWIGSDNYDIVAKAGHDATVQQMEGPMLQALLEERFKMKLHRETKMLPLYEMTIAKGGLKLRPSDDGSCTRYVTDAPPKNAASQGGDQAPYCGLHMTAQGMSRTLDGKGVSMTALATNLSRSYNTPLGRNVIDKTGTSGNFDIHLKWTNDPNSSSSTVNDAASPPDNVDTSIFTALQEQSGLKLQSGKGAVEVLVMDHIEKPSPN